MPSTKLAVTLITLKLASGSVLLRFQDPQGGVRYEAVIPNADFTSINTTTNGGSTGATQTFTYTQDQNRTDYDMSSYERTT